MKPQELRRRKNKAPSAAVLPGVPVQGKPELPAREGGWHALTIQMWTTAWDSPMASRWMEADLQGLFVLAELTEQFWRKPGPVLAKEIRQARMAYGLTPLDRNRLQWKIDPAEKKTPEPVASRPAFDPRKVLEMRKAK